MKTDITTDQQTTHGRRTIRRPVVACAAAALLWCAWNYCAGEGGTALFWTTAALAGVAIILPRPLPSNSRWIIWVALALTVVCLAANVERLVPTKNDFIRLYVMDRVATAAFASLGVSALFFRLGGVGVTRIMLGVLPMTMLAITRDRPGQSEGAFAVPLQIWVLFALLALLEIVRQAAAQRSLEGLSLGKREWAARACWLAALLGLAMALRVPVEGFALEAQRRILGMSMHSRWRWDPPRDTELALFRALPKGFSGRTRILLLAKAQTAPGYLRESVFTTYSGGRWLSPESGTPLNPANGGAHPGEAVTRYRLAPAEAEAPLERMRFEAFAPKLLTGICLPGQAVALYLSADEDDPSITTNGRVHIADSSPERYEADVLLSESGEGAYPLPDAPDDPAYLALPLHLLSAVSNWVEDCAGLLEAESAAAAAQIIENDFADRMVYRDDVKMHPQPDPLINFMKLRKGYCIHFASAAALMLRARGIPTRLVGGFICSEWAPWLGRWVVRERQGHAWVEAWDAESQRWFLVEATPANGRPDQPRPPAWPRRLQDLAITGWKRLLAFVEGANALQLIADAGGAVARALWKVLSSLWGFLLLLAALAGWLWRRHKRRRQVPSQEEQLRVALTQAALAFVRQRVPERLQRRAWESWEAWLPRVAPELPAARWAEVAEGIDRYQRLRYRIILDPAAAHDCLRTLQGKPKR